VGESRYLDVCLAGRVRLADALNHLYVLLPVLDDGKHYWVSDDEVDKLIRAGAGWLGTHPEKVVITNRYLAHRQRLTQAAMARLADVDETDFGDTDFGDTDLGDTDLDEIDNATQHAAVVDTPAVDTPAIDGPGRAIPLAEQRRGAVLAAVRASGAHMLVCRTQEAARERFSVPAGQLGAAWTRTGRSFFPDQLGAAFIDRIRNAAEAAGLFAALGSPWVLIDAEILPWSAKAGQLLRDQYAAVGAAARAALPATLSALEQAAATGLDVGGLYERTRARAANAAAFAAAYRRYCWPTDGLAGLRIAPFQVLAADGSTYHDREHAWHLELADRLVAADADFVTPTRRVFAAITDPDSLVAATQWLSDLTAAGGEGMVVKPAANLTRGRKGLVQPGLKVRGPEYLRIIYGPDYTESANLDRLRTRSLGHKRSLALREYALGLEALDRVARGEPLWRVHECVFAVLALESEPVDPRL
jgi:protein phosphatase